MRGSSPFEKWCAISVGLYDAFDLVYPSITYSILHPTIAFGQRAVITLLKDIFKIKYDPLIITYNHLFQNYF